MEAENAGEELKITPKSSCGTPTTLPDEPFTSSGSQTLHRYNNDDTSWSEREPIEIKTRMRSSGFLDMNLKKRLADESEALRPVNLKETETELGPQLVDKPFNVHPVGERTTLLGGGAKRAEANIVATRDSTSCNPGASTSRRDAQSLLSFENEPTSRRDYSAIEIATHVKADKFMQMTVHTRLASDTELDDYLNILAKEKAKEAGIPYANILQNKLKVDQLATRDLTVIRGPRPGAEVNIGGLPLGAVSCSDKEYMKILGELKKRRASVSDEEDIPDVRYAMVDGYKIPDVSRDDRLVNGMLAPLVPRPSHAVSLEDAINVAGPNVFANQLKSQGPKVVISPLVSAEKAVDKQKLPVKSAKDSDAGKSRRMDAKAKDAEKPVPKCLSGVLAKSPKGQATKPTKPGEKSSEPSRFSDAKGGVKAPGVITKAGAKLIGKAPEVPVGKEKPSKLGKPRASKGSEKSAGVPMGTTGKDATKPSVKQVGTSDKSQPQSKPVVGKPIDKEDIKRPSPRIPDKLRSPTKPDGTKVKPCVVKKDDLSKENKLPADQATGGKQRPMDKARVTYIYVVPEDNDEFPVAHYREIFESPLPNALALAPVTVAVNPKKVMYYMLPSSIRSLPEIIPEKKSNTVLLFGGFIYDDPFASIGDLVVGFKLKDHSWFRCPRMFYSRFGHEVVLFKEKPLIVGGYNNLRNDVLSGPNNCCFHYDLSGSFVNVDVAGMKFQRAYHSIVNCENRVYTVGGKDEKGSLDAVEALDSVNSWVKILDLPFRTSCQMCFTLKDKIWIAGGIWEDGEDFLVSSSVGILDPKNLSLATGCSYLPVNLFNGTAVVLNDVPYIIGGVTHDCAAGTFTTRKQVMKYVKESNSWIEIGKLPHPLQQARVAVYGNFIYIFGGLRDFYTCEVSSAVVKLTISANAVKCDTVSKIPAANWLGYCALLI